MKPLLIRLLGSLVLALPILLPAAAFKFPGQTLTVPDGFEIERVAGPPLVDRPIAAAFDEQGRLYVSDSSGSNDKVDKQLAERPHRILRLEDTDGDGRFDKRIVFAEHMMFPEGVMYFEGSVYVGAPPSIWKLTDTNSDGVADQREEWHKGQTLTGCANDMHGPYPGPDGWIYWCKGAFAEQNYDLGGGRTFKSRAAHIFRKRPGGSGLEAVMTGGMDNPVDVAFTRGGERFFTTTFVHQPEAGKRDGLVHAAYGGVYGKVNNATDGHKRTGDLMPVMVLWGAAAPCGLTRFESAGLGRDVQDNFFACLFNLHKITRHELTPDGATYRSKTTDFVTSDSPDFHPTDVVEDADGSLLVIDTGGWYKLCCPTSQLAKPDVLGGIYRIRRRGASKVIDPRGLQVNWAGLKGAALTAFLGDERVAVRQRAVEALARRGDGSIKPLATVLAKSPAAEARLHAVWTLTRLATPAARAALHPALRDRDAEVRMAAIHGTSLNRDATAKPMLLTILKSDDAAHRRAAAEALGRLGDRTAIPGLMSAWEERATSDRFLEHSLLFALMEIDEPTAVRPFLASDKSDTKRAALIALDQMEGGGLEPGQVTPFLASTDADLKQTAWWVVGHHTEWGEALSGFFRARLVAPSLSAAEREELPRQLAQLARNPSIQELITQTVHEKAGAGEPGRIAWQAMTTAGLKETPSAWVTETISALGSSDATVLRLAVSASRSFSLPKTGAPGLNAALAKVGHSVSVPAETRLDALAALSGGLAAVEPDLFSFLHANLEPGRPVGVRGAAASVLGRAHLDSMQLLTLAEAMRSAGPLEQPRLLTAFDKQSDENLGLKLVAALKESKRGGLREELVKPLLTNFPARVQREGEGLLALLNADAAKQKAHLERLLTECTGGDVRRGQTIFNSTKAACSACHAIGYLGGRVGPDLTSIGQVRTERDLLESIVYPSASFVRSYEPIVVSTKAGDEVSGVLRRETSEELVLATGPETEVRVARGDIAEMRPGTVSVMPQGLDEQLSRQELADLLAFLKNTKWGAQ